MEEPPPRGSGACGRVRSMILYAERRRQRRSADNRRRTTTTTPGAAANSLEGCYPPPNVTFHINLLFRRAGDGCSGGAKLSDPQTPSPRHAIDSSALPMEPPASPVTWRVRVRVGGSGSRPRRGPMWASRRLAAQGSLRSSRETAVQTQSQIAVEPCAASGAM